MAIKKDVIQAINFERKVLLFIVKCVASRCFSLVWLYLIAFRGQILRDPVFRAGQTIREERV